METTQAMRGVNWDFITDIIFTYLVSRENILALLFVVIIMASIKYFTPKMNNNWNHLIAFGLGLIGTFLLKENNFLVKKFWFDLLMTVFCSFLVYTTLAKMWFDKWIKNLQIKNGLVEAEIKKVAMNQTDIDSVKEAEKVLGDVNTKISQTQNTDNEKTT